MILGHQYEHIGLMLSLKQKGLLDKGNIHIYFIKMYRGFFLKQFVILGEYFVVGVDIEQYDSSKPDKYLQGLLQDDTVVDADTIIAFKSYLAVVPSAPVAFDSFARLVSTVFFFLFIENCISVEMFFREALGRVE